MKDSMEQQIISIIQLIFLNLLLFSIKIIRSSGGFSRYYYITYIVDHEI